MAIKIHNSFTGRKEEFTPIRKGRAGIYACGPTVYDEPHIGHARAAFTFDIIRKYLEFKGYKVKYVRNITDVDDKIIDKARAQSTEHRVQSTGLKKKTKEVAEKYLRKYKEDIRAIGISDPDKEPRATRHIKDMIKVIKALIKKGHAYVSGRDVYFDVKSFDDYGKLSHQDIGQMQSGEGKSAGEGKRSPLDFALWKGAKPDEPSWKSPWGLGRPGWHIECSAMSMRYLGETIDIHGGGRDLIFPHHENEIAQSEAYSGKKFANFWVHNGLLTINGEKMSKSAGNFTSISDLLKDFNPEAVKLFFLSAHYASPVDYSTERMAECRRALGRFYILFDRIKNISDNREQSTEYRGKRNEKVTTETFDKEIEALRGKFMEAMDDDFNTALAISALFDMVNASNRLVDSLGVSFAAKRSSLKRYVSIIRECGNVLGLFRQEAFNAEGEDADMDKKLVDLLTSVRDELRDKKEFGLSDKIRDALKAMGIILEDKDGKTAWRRE
ncbi:MAG: cysteine--tRNA ligase [Candidatus Omnitrophica bacterium CG1_02_49_10]|nr:MAG: cysteine--tRNA ligase [Candidatus Omnitrophica bacterium CG1_02_49_10]